MKALLWLHLVAASTWLGGMVMLGVALVAAHRTLDPERFRAFIRLAGRIFGGVSVVAWLLIGVSGLAMASRLGWSRPLVDKTGLAVLVVLMTAGHVVLGRRTGSRPSIITSRVLGLLVLAGTLAVYWMAVNL